MITIKQKTAGKILLFGGFFLVFCLIYFWEESNKEFPTVIIMFIVGYLYVGYQMYKGRF